MMRTDLNDLAYFAEVVRHGGFAAAGRALREPKSKLSRRVAALEERLGLRLIERSSRRFRVPSRSWSRLTAYRPAEGTRMHKRTGPDAGINCSTRRNVFPAETRTLSSSRKSCSVAG